MTEAFLPNDKPCPHCGRFNNRRLAVDPIIVKDNKILLIKRGKEPFKNHWAFSGGGVDWDESVEDAIIRETFEETGLVVKSIEFFGIYSKPERDPFQAITIVYIIEAEGTPKAGDDAKELQWFDLDKLPELAFDHGKIISDYLKGK